MFEPGTRNTGTAIAGRNIANPIAMLNASVDMLYFLGHKTYADAISNAIRKTIVEDRIHTPGKCFFFIFFHLKFKRLTFCFMPIVYCQNSFCLDLGGNSTSSDVIQNILNRLGEEDIHW